MKLFDVYPLFNVTIVRGLGCTVWDDRGQDYLDLYGGSGVNLDYFPVDKRLFRQDGLRDLR